MFTSTSCQNGNHRDCSSGIIVPGEAQCNCPCHSGVSHNKLSGLGPLSRLIETKRKKLMSSRSKIITPYGDM